MADERRGEQRFERRMSDAETLMWNLDKDPWLNPSGCSLLILDGPVDVDHFRSHGRPPKNGWPRQRDHAPLRDEPRIA